VNTINDLRAGKDHTGLAHQKVQKFKLSVRQLNKLIVDVNFPPGWVYLEPLKRERGVRRYGRSANSADDAFDPREENTGTEWLRSKRSAILQVPSVLIQEEPNYLLNPSHPESENVFPFAARDFFFDPRLKQHLGSAYL
jgi:hypothetical protein